MCPAEQAIYVCSYYITVKSEPFKFLSFSRRLLFRLLPSEMQDYVILQADRNILVEH
jgi:hypothetical protein